jgi:hypothetical protein
VARLSPALTIFPCHNNSPLPGAAAFCAIGKVIAPHHADGIKRHNITNYTGLYIQKSCLQRHQTQFVKKLMKNFVEMKVTIGYHYIQGKQYRENTLLISLVSSSPISTTK